MADSRINSNVVYNGPYETKQEHKLESSILDDSIASLQATAARFSGEVIVNNAVRSRYMAHIKQVAQDVRVDVENNKMTVLDAAKYCNQLRDKIFIEYRKYTTASGVAAAEKLKLKSRGFDFYLNKYARSKYSKDFLRLSSGERSAVYYEIIESAGRDSAKVSAALVKYEVAAKGVILVSGLFSFAAIVSADDQIRETARQGSIIASGIIGGTVAGFAVSFLCGPAEPLCAVATVTIGSSLGGMVGERVDHWWHEELRQFRYLIGN